MEAPRNWRMKVQRYRLMGVRYDNGNTSLVNRPQSAHETVDQTEDKQTAKATAA